jgi:predicted ribosome quality control (RQC) complex YloA/Tae2 family protein
MAMTASEPLAPLVGARVRRVDRPERDLVALTLSLEDAAGLHATEVLLVSSAPARGGVGLVDARPSGAAADAWCRLLRKHVEGAVIVGAAREGDALRVRLRRGPERVALRLAPGTLELEAQGRMHAIPSAGASPGGTPARALAGLDACTLEALREAGRALVGARSHAEDDATRRALARALDALITKLSRREQAVRGDLARLDDVPALRARAALLLAHLREIPRGASEVTLLDTTEDPPRARQLALDPARSPRAQAEAWFERARKLERGAAIARARLEDTVQALARARALRNASASDDAPEGTWAEIEAFLAGQRASDGGRRTPAARAARPGPRLPYRRIEGVGAREIRVGRSARDNDLLTRDHAAPHDLWLHARNVAGAHVVVPLARGEVCPSELLVDAATLAAHFSDLAGERVVEVDHLPRGRVRKRRGMAPGQVELDHPKTIAVRLEPDRLARLLGKPTRA